MTEFIDLIDKYLDIGRKFLMRFFNEKKLKPLQSNLAWSCLPFSSKGYFADHIAYFKHGFGIDFKDNNWKISIDFGDDGEWDGFDAGKLLLFAQDNKIKTSYNNVDDIEMLLEKGVSSGVFTKKGDLYFKR